jgi:nucleoside-diphosphate-sugar epimerase
LNKFLGIGIHKILFVTDLRKALNLKRALVLGAGGFIGNRMVTRLKNENYFVVGIDIKDPLFSKTQADNFYLFDLRETDNLRSIVSKIDTDWEIYQFAADMGGAGYIFTGENDAAVMHNSAMINLNLLEALKVKFIESTTKPKIFFSSSACIYPERNQLDPNNPNCSEDSAYPAEPDSEYGWEKLFSERLYLSYARNYGFPVRVARFHNIYGPLGTWEGGKEKAPAAICRKIAAVRSGDSIEVWGDGTQTRSFLYIDECIEAVRKFMSQEVFAGPVNIGSEEMVSINELVEKVAKISSKKININHIPGPLGVRGRNSDNTLIRSVLNWNYKMTLDEGLEITYKWIENELMSRNSHHGSSETPQE